MGIWFALFLLAEPVNFSREVLPVLSDKCLSCHGGDPSGRMANLRLDTREGATAKVIVPGDPDASLLLKRVTETNPRRLMPPERSHKARLTVKEVATLRAWIASGAPWGRHWSFEKPVRAPGRSIDSFIDPKLTTKNGPAPRHTLARRLSFDLTGLPPTAAMLAEPSYGALVDQLLASEHFGERMAMWWLDSARYADSDGFQADATRTNWPWRDWVVESFNRNVSFRQFTIEQFAGDLLPNATVEQRLATAFHRNHMTNGEGGRDPEESRVDYVLDRANTTGTVWLGLTLGCTQCHSHKFDPITHQDYYSFTAFFNSIDENGEAGRKAKPYASYASPYAARAVAEAERLVNERRPAEAAARASAEAPFAAWLAKQRGVPQAWRPLRMTSLATAEGTVLAQAADGVIVASGPNPRQDDYRLTARVALPRITGLKLEVLPPFTRGKSGDFLLTDIKVQVRPAGSTQIRDIAVKNAIADYSADKQANNNYGDIRDTLDDDPRNGWTTIGAPRTEPHTAIFELAEPLVLAAGEELLFEMRHRSTVGDANLARFRVSATDQRGPAVQTLAVAPLEELAKSGLTPALRERLFTQFLTDHAPYQAAREALDQAQRQLDEVQSASKVDVMVLAERATPRESHILLRGVWDKPGDRVQPAVLPAIGALPPGEKADRAGLARWLVSNENPLTARVIVNQLWQMLFGYGLVRTPEDFGLQGEQPTHPELLDWLAVEFMENGWDVKHVLRLIVRSEAYRRDSRATPEMLAQDPENRTLARGPRFRLASWMLRDAALAHAGLLNPALGGPPVRPYQPDGVWEELFMGRFKYEPSEGPAQYRRTLYAFWRRTIAPTFLFDSAQRRSCEVRTSRTNTPLQALTLLNDQTYLEASRVLAAMEPVRVFERVLARAPDAKERAVLEREYRRALAHYQSHPGDALKLAGGSPERAARMVLASLILNLDEAITHE
ncbi:MAG: PSD1 and planctomycete cytochrome C domain-containing protein [Bryobacteraceae bacterium]|nr:PSD1 and planctomycete cytochrome C domain-containing protein [Bryobacteraceae bacterium]